MTRRLLLAAGALALCLPGAADAARFAVGVSPGTDAGTLARTIEARTGAEVEPLAPFAVVVETSDPAKLRRLGGVTYVERLRSRGRRLAFAPNDPLATRQWHIGAVQAFDAWPQRPVFGL
ncbi:MAG TPA: hypothetical protein VHH55_06080, partial [Gaiellaceae bacterium]|nr:hypothetical protein [Gaiellaceae bacterium]